MVSRPSEATQTSQPPVLVLPPVPGVPPELVVPPEAVTPPDAVALEEPCRLLIWRHDVTPKFRELGQEEAMMWAEAASGVPFGVLCSMLATYDDPDAAAARAAFYLHAWIAAGLLTDAVVGN